MTGFFVSTESRGSTVAAGGERGEGPLDDPVLEGVEGDGDEASPGDRHANRRVEELGQAVELAVDLDAEGLEGLGRGVDLALLRPPAVDLLDDAAEVGGRLDPAELAQADDLPGQAAGVGQLAVGLEQVGQPRLRIGVEHPGGGDLASLVHPHVQRPVQGEAESPLRGIQLERGHPEVGEDPADVPEVDAQLGQELEVRLEEPDPPAEGHQDVPGPAERELVAVEADKGGTGIPLQDRDGVSRQAQGTVNINAFPPDVQELEDIRDEDRAMSLLRHSDGPRGMSRAMLSRSASESGFSSSSRSRASLFQTSR